MQRTVTVLVDDLHGQELAPDEGRTVTLSLDGVTFEVDLTNDDAQALQEALQPYMDAGRRLSRKGTPYTRTKVAPAGDTRRRMKG